MPVAPAPTAERPLFFGSSMLARTHGVRSHSTGSFQRPKQNPLEPQPCSPSGRLLAPIGSRRPSLPAAQQDDSELALWEGSSHSRGLRGRSRYLAPLSSQCSPDSRLASTCHIDWSGSKRASDSKCEARTGEAIVQWQPKASSQSRLVPKTLELTKQFCMSIPRSLSLFRPKREPGSLDLGRLNWPRQVNDRVAGPSGMLLRIERLRQAVIQMHGELQKNRSSLQVIRRSFQIDPVEADSSQSGMLAVTASSALPAIASPSRHDFSIECDLSPTIYTAELKDVLDKEAEEEEKDAISQG